MKNDREDTSLLPILWGRLDTECSTREYRLLNVMCKHQYIWGYISFKENVKGFLLNVLTESNATFGSRNITNVYFFFPLSNHI